MNFHSSSLLCVIMLLINSTGYSTGAKEKHDICIAEAQKKYDSCLVLANELIKESGRTKENEMGQKLLDSGCSKQLENDLTSCKAASQNYLKKQSIISDPKTNPDLLPLNKTE